ncbi:MAG: hypothetical protein LCH52_10520 [Bacteroidetes bacterium]|nr:hypothetical protein [Bacteroidota bacterium]
MRKIALILLLSPIFLFSQKLGDVAPVEKPQPFPPNTLGLDLMIGEAGFGLGGFYRKDLSEELTWFTDFSISEVKDDREFEYIDYWGRIIVVGKKNRIFQIPFSTGFQYRLFKESLTENLRPYISIGVGPNLIVTTPFEKEFFSSFGSAQAKIALGGYAGLGANFGINKKNLLGLNVRYYYAHLFDGGVEGMEGIMKQNISGIFLTITLGTMF